MSEQDIHFTETERTPAALGFARAYYAGALLAARHQPDDMHRLRRAEEAWQEYLEAAKKVGHSSPLPPFSFTHDPVSFTHDPE